MVKLLGLIGATLLGWVGWAIGAPISIFTAFTLSIVGTGFGLYLGRKVARNYF
jgi:phosphate/sulfate permease